MTNPLIPIHSTTIQTETVSTVSARDLHAFLEVGARCNDWISRRIEEYHFEKDRDFCYSNLSSKAEGRGGRNRKDCLLSLDMAKELSMVERNAKGKQARQYFIECERQAKAAAVAQPAPFNPRNLSRMDLIQLAMDAETERLVLEQQVTELTPKAEFHDAVAAAINCQTIQEIAKVFGVGSNRLFKWLREEKLLLGNNQPYQRYIDAGYFKVVEKCFRDEHGERNTYTRTLVTGKGLAYIHRRLQAPLPLAQAA